MDHVGERALQTIIWFIIILIGMYLSIRKHNK